MFCDLDIALLLVLVGLMFTQRRSLLPAKDQRSNEAEGETRSTLLLKELTLTPDQLQEFLDRHYPESYDFIKLPYHKKAGRYQSFAFVNFVSTEQAVRFMRHSGLVTRWSEMQGQRACLATLRPVMLSVPPSQQPVVMKDGKRVDLRCLLEGSPSTPQE